MYLPICLYFKFCKIFEKHIIYNCVYLNFIRKTYTSKIMTDIDKCDD